LTKELLGGVPFTAGRERVDGQCGVAKSELPPKLRFLRMFHDVQRLSN